MAYSHCSRWGIGLRPQQTEDLEELEILPQLEVIADNLLGQSGGPGLYWLQRLQGRCPLHLHGVGMNLGSVVGTDIDYLQALKSLCERMQPRVISDHLALTRTPTHASFELLPFPRNAVMLQIIAANIDRVQEALGRTIAVENISAYVAYQNNSYSEGGFIAELVQRTGCGVLLDINNLVVNAHNFHQDLQRELADFPLAAVQQVHVAGHTVGPDYLFDTHDQPASVATLALLRQLLPQIGGEVPIILEDDAAASTLTDTLRELSRIRAFVDA